MWIFGYFPLSRQIKCFRGNQWNALWESAFQYTSEGRMPNTRRLFLIGG